MPHMCHVRHKVCMCRVCAGKPGILDMAGRAKWDAWDKKKGMSQDEAKTAYIE